MTRLLVLATLLLLAACGSSTTKTVTTSAAPTTPRTPTTSTAPTTPRTTAATPSQPVYFVGAAGPATQKPSSLQLTADGTLSVERVQWTSWGGAQATGSGSALYHGCTPNCAAAPTHTALVSVRLSEVRTCGGRRYYAGVTLTLDSGRLLDQGFLQRPWSPC